LFDVSLILISLFWVLLVIAPLGALCSDKKQRNSRIETLNREGPVTFHAMEKEILVFYIRSIDLLNTFAHSQVRSENLTTTPGTLVPQSFVFIHHPFYIACRRRVSWCGHTKERSNVDAHTKRTNEEYSRVKFAGLDFWLLR